MQSEIAALIKQEGWDTFHKKGELFVRAEGIELPYRHPFAIHAKLYRHYEPGENRFRHLRAMHRYAWPQYEETWTYWDDRRFRALADGYNYISYAGGASTAKSHCAARLACLFWLLSPDKRTVTVASTTLQAASVRIWGYITRMMSELAVKLPFIAYGGNAPKILYSKKDPIHGMYAVAAGKGTDEKAIKDWIGKHPKEAHMIILDEATDLDPIVLKSLPNLESGGIEFNCTTIGNSLSKFDLHGALSTPAAGWKNIDPLKDTSWPTTQRNGICLFFSCHESPAIFETDPEKKQKLERFYITSEQIVQKAKLYGENSDSFYRFVLGFWRDDSTDSTVISRRFINEFGVSKRAEWSGIYPLQIVAGLDPAFSTGGDQCVLRLGVLGQDVGGRVMLDFRGEDLLFRIKINARSDRSAELQIADEVLAILEKYGGRVANLCIDATGQGRALGEVIRLRAGSIELPIKIYSTRFGTRQVDSFDVVIKTSLELWTDVRDFVQNDQLRGLDEKTIAQLTSRLIEVKGSKQALEAKSVFKARMGAVSPSLAHSPDEADALALCLQAAKIKFGFTPGQVRKNIDPVSFMDEKMWVAQQLSGIQSPRPGTMGVLGNPPIAGFDGVIEDGFGNLLNFSVDEGS